MSWVLPVLLAWSVLALPGCLALRLVDARVPLRWGWAPAVTVVIMVVLSGALRAMRVPWQPLSVTVGLCVLLATLFGARRALAALAARAPDAGWSRMLRPQHDLRTAPAWSGQASAAVTIAGLLSGLLTVAAATRRMGGIDTLNGSYDSFFHLSAVAFIREGGDAWLTTALLDIYGTSTFYPVVFDALAALLPFDTVTAANAMMLALLAALPSAVAAMIATTTRSRQAPLLAALGAAASTLFLSVPAMGLVMGLWPVVLGSVCLPVAVATVFRLLEHRRDRFDLRSAAGAAVVLAGTALAHPSVLFSVAVVAGLLILVHGISRLRSGQRRRGLVQIAASVGAVVAFLVISGTLLAGMHLTRHSTEGAASVLWDVVVDSPRIPVIGSPMWPLALVWLLAGIGAATALRHREAVGTTATIGVLATLLLGVSTQIEHPLAVALVNPWYGARERIAPLAMCLLIVLMARGLAALFDARRGAGRSVLGPLAVAALLVTVTLGVVVPHRLPVLGSLAYTAYGAQLSPYASPQEREFIERTAAELPDDAVVLADPRDGATLYWSLGGVETVYPTMAAPQTRDQRLVARYITEADEHHEVCEALERIGPTHLYRDTSEFSGRSMDPEASAPWRGVHDIPDSDLTLVSSNGPYALHTLEHQC